MVAKLMGLTKNPVTTFEPAVTSSNPEPSIKSLAVAQRQHAGGPRRAVVVAPQEIWLLDRLTDTLVQCTKLVWIELLSAGHMRLATVKTMQKSATSTGFACRQGRSY